MLAAVGLLAILSVAPHVVDVGDGAVAEGVADELVAGGFDNDAIERLRALLVAWPGSTRRGVWQAKIVKAVARRGDRDAFVVEAARLTAEISNARQQPVPNTDLAEAEEMADAVLRGVMTTWHLEGQGRHLKRGAASADVVYRLWFSLFDDSPFAADMHFFHGELLSLLERYDEAADAYETSARRDPRGRWAEAAAEGAVVASIEVARDERSRAVSSSPSPSPLTLSSSRLVRVSDAYVAAWPSGWRATEARYRAALAFADAGHVDEARARFFAVIDTAPDAPRAEQAAAWIDDHDDARGETDLGLWR